MGIFPLSFEKFLWSAKYDRENRKVYCPGRATSHTKKKKKNKRSRRVASHLIAELGITATWSKGIV